MVFVENSFLFQNSDFHLPRLSTTCNQWTATNSSHFLVPIHFGQPFILGPPFVNVTTSTFLGLSPTLPSNDLSTLQAPTHGGTFPAPTTSNDSNSLSPTQVRSSPLASHPTHHQPQPMVIRSQNNIFKPKQLYLANSNSFLEFATPSSVIQALKHAHWCIAMSEEFNALMKNSTWTIVPPTFSQNVIGCKWIFRIKRNPDGSISRYKAHLVAKGFYQ